MLRNSLNLFGIEIHNQLAVRLFGGIQPLGATKLSGTSYSNTFQCSYDFCLFKHLAISGKQPVSAGHIGGKK